MVNATIDGLSVCVENGTSILDAAKSVGILIPHLCYLKEINEIAACRVCVVEVDGTGRLVPACNNELLEGMVVRTNSPRVRQARRTNLRLILSQHDTSCTTCIRNGNCMLQKLSNDLNIHYQPYRVRMERTEIDMDVPLIREASKCIKCMRCIQICDKVQNMKIWDVAGTGSRTTVDVSYNRKLKDTDCTYCGQCVTHCPTGALTARDDTNEVFHALADPDITTVVQVAPAVRVAWAEAFQLSPEFATIGRLVSALRHVGFDYVFDTDFSADLTIVEESHELAKKLTHRNQYRWPMFTSCCPAWVRFLKSQYPSYVDCLSTAKSPQQMFGSVVKSYFAEQKGIDPKKLFVVSIMPCIAKKQECELPTMKDAHGVPSVDAVLTTREICRVFHSEHIVPVNLKEESFDSPLGISTGAGVIFGATGGVMVAALRSAYCFLTGSKPDPDAFQLVHKTHPWKEGTFSIPKIGKVHVAAVSGLSNTRRLMEAIDKGDVSYDFVEVMACPGGCAGGGGQPIHEGLELAEKRGECLWQIDSAMPLRFSHENPEVQILYRKYLGQPLKGKAHDLLHTDHNAWKMPSQILKENEQKSKEY